MRRVFASNFPPPKKKNRHLEVYYTINQFGCEDQSWNPPVDASSLSVPMETVNNNSVPWFFFFSAF